MASYSLRKHRAFGVIETWIFRRFSEFCRLLTMPPIRSVILVSVVLASEVRWKICEIGTFPHSHGTYRIFPRAPANSLIPYSCSICSKILQLICSIRNVKNRPCVFIRSLLYGIILYWSNHVKGFLQTPLYHWLRFSFYFYVIGTW